MDVVLSKCITVGCRVQGSLPAAGKLHHSFDYLIEALRIGKVGCRDATIASSHLHSVMLYLLPSYFH